MNNRTNPASIRVVASRLRRRVRPIGFAAASVLVVAGLAGCFVQTDSKTSGQNNKSTRCFDVALSLVNYSDVHGHLPDPVVRRAPARQSKEAGLSVGVGEPLYSWRVEIVPYLESWHGTWDPAQPWDDPDNRQLAELSSFYAFDTSEPKDPSQPFPETNILAITGPGTAFGDGTERPMDLKNVPVSTIIALKVRSSGIPWPAPGDLDIRTMPHSVGALVGDGISSSNAGGFHVIFADGYVWLLSEKVPFETLASFFTPADAKEHNRDQLLGAFALRRGP